MNSILLRLTASASEVSEVLPTTAENVQTALVVMAKGMIGIFIALSVIYGFTLLLTWLFPSDKAKEEAAEKKNAG
ncbi:MAG: hypothetical protein ACYCYM_10180 [Saccharofermentanales bacterium]